MIIDCDTCAVRDLACGDCVVRVLLAGPGPLVRGPDVVELDDEHRGALDVLAGSGLVPPLRLVLSLPAVQVDADADEALARDAEAG